MNYGSSRNEFEMSGVVVAQGEHAVLFFDDESVQEIWISRAKVMDWWFTKDRDNRDLEIEDLERNDEVTLVIPRWIAKREGLCE